jgi:MFS family permease
VAGFAWSPWVLIAGRVLQGLGAAAFVPTSLSLLTSTFTAPDVRSRALAVYGAMAGIGFVTGMVGGGLITDWWGWRWIFLINLPLVAVTLVPVRRVLARSRGSAAHGPVDVGGAVAATVALVLIIYALTTAAQDGWLAPATVGTGTLGCAALVVLFAVERRHRNPLVPPATVAKAAVLAPNAAITLQSMVGVAWLFLLTLHLQDVRGLTASAAGWVFAPMTVASVAGAAVAGRMVPGLGRRTTAATGIALVAASLLVMAYAAAPGRALALLIGAMVVGEAGFMLGSVALTMAATSSLGDSDAGLAAGLLNTATQLGGGIGLGVVASVVAAATPASGGIAGPVRLGFVTCAVFSAAALAVVVAGMRTADHGVISPEIRGNPRR